MEAGLASVGVWVAFALTLMVYCYLVKEIPLFHAIYRVAVYLFIGVTLAYAALIAWHGVLVPRLFLRLDGGEWLYLPPLILCLLLVLRVRPAWRGPGTLTLAFLLGVGAALTLGGALVGTLLPQVAATFVSLNPEDYQVMAMTQGSPVISYVLDALLVVLGTVSALLYFFFTAPEGTRRLAGWQSRLARLFGGFGRVFIMFTLGALFATVSISRISLLVDRARFLIETFLNAIPAL